MFFKVQNSVKYLFPNWKSQFSHSLVASTIIKYKELAKTNEYNKVNMFFVFFFSEKVFRRESGKDLKAIERC